MILRHRRHKLARALAASAVAAALSASPALARIDPPATPAFNPRENGSTYHTAPAWERTVDNGFDWGSAAIGAGGTGALVVLIALGAAAYTARHRIGVEQ